jgi:primosomal protein N' (replication factor Y)
VNFRRFAEVIVFSPATATVSGQVERAFTYHLPDELEGCLAEGSLVVVPFGRRRLYGVVVALADASPVPKTRPIESLADPEPVLTPAQVELAHWMSHEYLTPLHECLDLMLPPGLVGHTDVLITLDPQTPANAARTDAQAALLALLRRRGPLRGAQLDAALRGTDWRAAAEQLAHRHIVACQSFLASPSARPKQVDTAQIVPAADEEAALAGLRSEVYPAIVEFLRAESGPVDVSWVYAETGCKLYHLKKLAEALRRSGAIPWPIRSLSLPRPRLSRSTSRLSGTLSNRKSQIANRKSFFSTA